MTHKGVGRFVGGLAPGLIVSACLFAVACTVLAHITSLSRGTDGAVFAALGSRDWRVLLLSLAQAGASTLVSLVFGIPLAWGLSHQRRFWGRSALIGLVSSALVTPTLVVSLAMVSVLGRNGWINSFLEAIGLSGFGGALYGPLGILVAHAFLNGSLVMRSSLASLDTIPIEKRKVAQSLGFSVWHRFRYVEWPALKAVLPSVCATIFLLCFTSFAIVLTLGGSPRYNTLEVSIYEAIKLEFAIARAMDLATLQLITCAILVGLSSRLRISVTPLAPPQRWSLWPEPIALKRIQMILIGAIGLFFVAPVVAIVWDGLGADLIRIASETGFKKALMTSIVLALCAALLGLGGGLALAAAMRDLTSVSRLNARGIAGLSARILGFSAGIYLVVPALVLGLGFFLAAQSLPGTPARWAAVALLLANSLFALPFVVAIVLPPLMRAAVRYDRLAFSLDIKGWRRWRAVDWPIVAPAAGYAFAVAFCFSFGDLGVIALFGSENFATLPWYLHQKMASYRTDDAAGVALIILGLTLAALAGLPQLLAQKRGAASC